MLRNRFDEAGEDAGATFQFRDIRAKAATDTGDLGHAQRLLGHKTREMTSLYAEAAILLRPHKTICNIQGR